MCWNISSLVNSAYLFGALVVATGLRVVGVGFTSTTGATSVVVVLTSGVVVVSSKAVLNAVSGVTLGDEQETRRRARTGTAFFLTNS